MATLKSLKENLQHKVTTGTTSLRRPLSDLEYSAGFDIIKGDLGRSTYQDFIIPQLTMLLRPLVESGTRISMLEIGPGPQSIIGDLPYQLKRMIRRYTAFEPNKLFASRLEATFSTVKKEMSPLPCLEGLPHIQQTSFTVDSDISIMESTANNDNHFDVILFCHSMYGMKPKRKIIERALEMLVKAPSQGLIIVFHRESTFPTAVLSIADDDKVLDQFAPFVAGFAMQESGTDEAVKLEWRKVCRALGRREEAQRGRLLFSSPDMMVTFTCHSTALPELTTQVPSETGHRVKNRQARLHYPACIARPTEIRHIQHCVNWALKHRAGLTVLGGGHSGHCLWSNVVAVDMGAFNQVHVIEPNEDQGSPPNSNFMVVAGAGCKSGDIVRETMAAGLTVPLGARPSVGAGLWLQGGIGHLARLHGLTCDTIVGAVMVCVATGCVLCIGCVPSQHQPVGSMRPQNESDLLWALKGAGTNFGIVVSITFLAYKAPIYSVRNWVIPLNDNVDAQLRLGNLAEFVARKSSRNCSVGAYIYGEEKKLWFGVTTVESTTAELANGTFPHDHVQMCEFFGPEDSLKVVDGIGLFETEMYMSGLHGGHGGGKTSSFKRCLFLTCIGALDIANILVSAVETRPSPLCYIHLLQGGGSVHDVAPHATAFGCRDWDFACVITGVWPREQDETEISRSTIRWVYQVAKELLPLSCGAYGADLGPDPRDATLAVKAFGLSLPQLISLKHIADPQNVLAYACPLSTAPMAQTLIILVTGESCAGKDYCANIWASTFTTRADKSITARVVSISDTTKREYAEATGADFDRLRGDRRYKEQHRAALTKFFQDQLHERPQLPEEHFLNVVRNTVEFDVLLITGMRDQAPVAAFSHLVPKSRLLEVRIQASKKTRWARGGTDSCTGSVDDNDQNGQLKPPAPNYPPSFTFTNEATGDESAIQFAQTHLLSFFDNGLQSLASMARLVPNFPRAGVDFRHVLDISQQPGGLELCTTLLQAHFAGDWEKIDVVVCCEVGGIIYASALALRVGLSLALIRDAGKLPPPTISVSKSPSHISSFRSSSSEEKRFEMGPNAVPKGASVVVVDDVLASGTTLCAVLQLLDEAGVSAEHVHVMVVAEFPIHRGRQMLHRRGFGGVKVQSLLGFDGV